MTRYIVIPAILMLSACSPSRDMQGYDPTEYYAAHPIKNTVESHDIAYIAHFMPKSDRLSDTETDNLRTALRDISPMAVDAVHVKLSKADMHNSKRQLALAKTLRDMGYVKGVMFDPSADLRRDDVQISVTYLAIVPPADCPDWRTSPVTTYSNTQQGNFNCATQTNMGLMIADPHDLVRGTGDVTINTPRATKAASDYENSVGASSSSSSSSGSSSSSSPTPSGGAPPSPQ
jgi:pilus biogenesis lipoprotein CpaD